MKDIIQINPDFFFVAAPDVSTRLIGDKEAVLFNPDTGCEKFLNSSGLFIWERLNGAFTVRDIVDRLLKNFESSPSDQVLKDVEAFLIDMSEHEFVIPYTDELSGSKNIKEFPAAKDSPKSVDISLTGKCNLRCGYCFYADEMKTRNDLPAESWLSFFKKLGRLAVRDVCLSGGELFTRSDLWELIDGVITNRMRYSILTNGTLLTDNTLEFFNKNKRRSRLNSIQVSIDGSCPEIHDMSRGKGSFDKAVRGLRLLKKAGFPVTSRVTVNRHNVDDLDNIARFLLDDIGLNNFGTNDAMPMGAGCYNQGSITLKPEQQLKAMKTLARLAEKHNGRITATAGPLAKWKTFGEMGHARATGEKPTRWQMGFLTACGGVFNKLAIHHDGRITPCHMLPKLELGRITSSIREIWTKDSTLEALRQRRNIPMTEVPGCKDCEWALYCNGGCPGLAHEMTGDFNRANPHDCYSLFLGTAAEET